MLAFMFDPVQTVKRPEVAPVGIVKTMLEGFQERIVIGRPFSITTPLPCVAPKLEPPIPIVAPTEAVVTERAAIDGAPIAAELTDTLSSVVVRELVVEPLATAKPT